MNEKLKGFLSKDNPSDEELELFLFAMNQQNAAVIGAIKKLVEHIDDYTKAVDVWIRTRLRSDKPLSAGLRDEMRIAMRTLADLHLSLENAADFAEMRSEASYKKYRNDDHVGHFRWKDEAIR